MYEAARAKPPGGDYDELETQATDSPVDPAAYIGEYESVTLVLRVIPHEKGIALRVLFVVTRTVQRTTRRPADLPRKPTRRPTAGHRAREDRHVKGAESSAFEIATAGFHQALRTNDAEALFAYVADDVLLMPPGEEAVRGKNAMRDWYAAFLSQYSTSSLTLSDREVFVGERWAVELGTYEWALAPAGGGGDVLDRGNYMQLWQSQSDGQWRFHREIWNSSAPVTPPE